MITKGYSRNALIFDPFDATSSTLPNDNCIVYNPVTHGLMEEHWPNNVKKKLSGIRYIGLVEPKVNPHNMDLKIVLIELRFILHITWEKRKPLEIFSQIGTFKVNKHDEVNRPDGALHEIYYKWFYEQILKGFAKETLTFKPFKIVE